MINKLVVDGQNITLNESTVLPFTYTFSTAGVHNVKVGLDNTNEICAYAFKDCEDLTNVISIPERITMIKRNAFENCTSLKKFNVPSSIEYVGPNVFDGCISLKEIKFNTPNPPRFFSNLDSSTTCYIPDGSKFIKVEDNSELVKDGSVQYYEKNILGGYDEIDYEALDDNGEYYYDNWTTVHDHYNTVEERFRVKPTQIEFLDNGVTTTLYGDVNAGDEGDIFPHHIIPENSTNNNVFLYSTNERVLQIDQDGHFTTYAGLLGNASVNVCICTEPDYYGTYAFTQLRFRVRATQVITDKVDMTLEFPEDYSISVNNVNVGDTIEFETPTLSGDDNLDNPVITYTSSDEDVAKFENGVLKAKSNGTTTITATYAGDDVHKSATASFEITVAIHEEEPEPTYTITFKDGDTILKTITGPTGTSVSASDITLEKEGYDFNGWSINGTTAILPVDEITDTDITYIALWVEAQPETPTNLFYIGTTIPTNTNIDGLDTEEIGEWTADNRKTIDMSALQTPTSHYVMVPENHAAPIINDPNDNPMQSDKLQSSVDNYDVYEFELGQAIYTLYFE